VTLAPREGSFAPWWKLLSVEVYGAVRPAAAASTSAPGAGSGTTPISIGFDAEYHRITTLIPDEGKGQELRIAY